MFCVILSVTHSCIIATIQLFHPDGREAISRYIDWIHYSTYLQLTVFGLANLFYCRITCL